MVRVLGLGGNDGFLCLIGLISRYKERWVFM